MTKLNKIISICIYGVCYYYRHLLEEFQTEKEKWKEEKEKMSTQLLKLQKENETQQELLAIEFDKNPQCDAILQSDINKLNYDHFVRQRIIFYKLCYLMFSLNYVFFIFSN